MAEAVFKVDAAHSQVHIFTFKAGLLSAMGHDLRLSADNYECAVKATPSGQLELKVTVQAKGIKLDGEALHKPEGVTVQPLGGWASGEIIKNMQSKHVLDVDRHPTITYVGLLQPGGQPSIVGDLELRGVKKPLSLNCDITHDEDGRGMHIKGQVEILQTTWGIEPFYTMMGAIKLTDNIKIEWDVRCTKEE
eukprot:GGOE01022515.1.p1 GENE.GGOE01022515.1~~GGOE01022515.1.p1  ORF type:complete len:192 (+),score=48.13 GGOE01022515.1:58-633(+)